MTNIEIIWKENMIVGIDIEGHTRSDVCTAISVLSINTANSLSLLSPAKFVKEPVDLNGMLSFEVEVTDDIRVIILLTSLTLGLRTIADKYQEHVNLKEVR